MSTPDDLFNGCMNIVGVLKRIDDIYKATLPEHEPRRRYSTPLIQDICGLGNVAFERCVTWLMDNGFIEENEQHCLVLTRPGALMADAAENQSDM